MEKAHEFNFYFTDERLAPVKLARMQLTRQIVHDFYPEVQERVSYGMPGFYPQNANKAGQQLFYLMANKNWLGIYGTADFITDESIFEQLDQMGVELTRKDRRISSLHVPYDLEEDKLKKLLQLIMEKNLAALV